MAKRKNNYWEKRIEEQLDKAYVRTNEETQKELSKIYRQCGQDIKDEIIRTYARIQNGVGDTGEILMTDFYRNKRYWELLNKINEHLNDLGKQQITITEPAIIEAYAKTLEILDKEVPNSVKGATLSFANFKNTNAEQVLFQAWCLDGKKFSDRVWTNKDSMLIELKKELNRCIVQGNNPWIAAERMARKLDVGESKAYTLLRTETAHAQIYAKVEKYKSYGITTGYWIAAPTCCEECQSHNGKEIPLDKIQSMIPAHPNCRCSFGVMR